jgi:hypothetical protein
MRLRASLSFMVVVALMVPALAAAAGPKEKTELCHIPPGNPGNAHTITVGGNASNAHLAHGDTLGACPVERPGKVDDDDDSSDDDTTGANRAPIAEAGPDQCLAYDKPIAFDGRSSSDLDGDTLSFLWTVESRPSGSTLANADISSRTSAQASVIPDRLGTYRFGLEVTDPHGASDDDTVRVGVHMDVELTEGPFVVGEGGTTPVTIYFTELAPQDVTVQLVLETNVAVVVPNEDDDATDAISSIVIKKGDNRATVYLYGVADADALDDSTVLNAIVGSTACGDTAIANVEVSDDEKQLQLEPGVLRLFFVLQKLEPWFV